MGVIITRTINMLTAMAIIISITSTIRTMATIMDITSRINTTAILATTTSTTTDLTRYPIIDHMHTTATDMGDITTARYTPWLTWRVF